MRKHLRVGLLVAAGFVCGWVTGQIGPWRAYGQKPDAVDKYTVHNLTGWELAIRHAGEQTITKDTKRVGIELFRDSYNGNLIYVTEAGAIAAVPEHGPAASQALPELPVPAPAKTAPKPVPK